MDRVISAAEANRDFSRLLREVRCGGSFVVTVRGKAVARIVRCQDADIARKAAQSALLQRLAGLAAADIGAWKRNELYDR